MKFSLMHKACSYAMVVASLMPMLLSADVPIGTRVFVLLAIVLSWFVEKPRFSLAWRIATFLFIAYVVVDLVWRDESVITVGINLLLYLMINKLFNRRASRDYAQLYIISFLMVIAGSALNTTLIFGVCFTGFLIFSIWTLVLFHLRRAMEEMVQLRQQQTQQQHPTDVALLLDSKRLVGLSFFGGTSLIAIGVMAGATAFFVLFPRIGFGLFGEYRRGGITMSGFNDQVQLGQHGRIRDNEQVVMRVTFPAGTPRQGLRWRGTALDHYASGSWRQSDLFRGYNRRVVSIEGLYRLNDAPGLPEGAKESFIREKFLKQEIYLEPLESMVIFGADRVVALDVQPSQVTRLRPFTPSRGPMDEILGRRMQSSGVRYAAYSWVDWPAPAQLRQAAQVRSPFLEPFLQMPAELPARVNELARKITAGKNTVYDKVLAVQNYLMKEYQYTQELQHAPGREPVAEFLFDTRRGHCEYFASAMAILLRTLGIHTRQVNGFSGGVWNEFGNFLAVRQSDAHSWVEVYFAEIGWIPFDPTPNAGRPQGFLNMSLIGRLSSMLDALRMRWNIYVIEYDLNKQLNVFSQLGLDLGRRRGAVNRRVENDQPISRRWWGVAIMLAGIFAIGATWWWQRRFGRRDAQHLTTPHWASLLYVDAIKSLSHVGLIKSPHLTPSEYCNWVKRHDEQLAEPLRELTHIYVGARFGPSLTVAERHRVSSELTKLKELVSTKATSRP